VVVNKLIRKLFRDIKRSIIQFCAITIVSAIGVMLLTGMAVVHLGLSNTAEEYYKESNLADFTAYYSGIDDAGMNKIKEIEGINEVLGRLSLEAENIHNNSSFLMHTVSSDQRINIPHLYEGHLPKTADEGMINAAYATENNLNIGDKLEVNVNQKSFEFTISGIFETAEYVYLVEDPTKSLIPNHKNFGLLFVNNALIERITEDTVYNEVLVTLNGDVDQKQVAQQVENTTEELGFGHIVFKNEQYSYQNLESDIVTTGSMSKLFPYIFFLVATVIIFISMSRTVQNERNQIGIMKALGMSSQTIALHYVGYSIVSGLIGGIAGNLLGITILPKLMFDTYDMLYTLPDIILDGYMFYILLSTVVVLLFGIAASLISIRKTLKEVPAQCMRPVPPKKVKKIWIEKRESIWRRISYNNKLIFRNIFLNKTRVILSSIGIIGCVGLLICGFGLMEVTGNFIDMQFNKIQKYDAMVLRSKPATTQETVPFENSDITAADKMSIIDVKVSANKNITSSLYVLNEGNQSIQLFDTNGHEIALPDDGVVFPYKLAKENGIQIGDTVQIKLESSLYEEKNIDAEVSAISELYVSQDLYTSYEYLKQFDIDPFVNGYYVTVNDHTLSNDTEAYLESVNDMRSVAVKAKLMEEMDSLYQSTKTTVYILIVMSACLSLAVIFNISSINIFERSRDIATLKVLGYHKKEINSLVQTENMMITAFGCLVGVFFGAFIFKYVLVAAESEEMYFPYHISVTMVVLSVLLTFAFTILANYMLRGKMNKIDMVESLKSVE
jgi:putative ABC transport system permease protein